MNSQNLETPVLLFKITAELIYEYTTNGADVIDSVMNRYSDYAYLIQDILKAKSLEDLENLKETCKDPDLYNPAQDMHDLRKAVMLIVAADNLYNAMTAENKPTKPRPQMSQFAYDALKKITTI